MGKILRVPYKMMAAPIPVERLQIDKSVLVLIDFQKYTCNRNFGLGILASERGIAPELDEYYGQVNSAVENSTMLLDASRKNGVKVIFSYQYAGAAGENISKQFRISKFPIPHGDLADEFLPQVHPNKGDEIITRAAYSLFLNSKLEEILRSEGKDTLIIAGTLFNYTVALAAREAAERDLKVIVVWDASASESLEWHQVTRTGLVGGLILSRRAQEVIEMMEGTRT
jgi:nicotinamidase-related amidase